ncbi:hypothetical protein EAG_01057 [Camponotus floridanus]|uniref:CUB domain-containing protein n=1 Tax=Camponotus floridanus TaxID=104421 RepID=E2AB41_CAMFO|nr:hypothetical protein EAG_01057 [Camponotus floridanus]
MKKRQRKREGEVLPLSRITSSYGIQWGPQSIKLVENVRALFCTGDITQVSCRYLTIDTTGCSCVVYSSSDRPQGGIFTSPNFPKRYPPNIDCLLYTFIGHPDEIIALTFHQFNIRRIWPEYEMNYRYEIIEIVLVHEGIPNEISRFAKNSAPGFLRHSNTILRASEVTLCKDRQKKSFMPRTRAILPQARAFAFVDVKSHDSKGYPLAPHGRIACNGTPDCTTLFPRHSVAVTCQPDCSNRNARRGTHETQYTSSATPVALYSLRCANPFRVIPLCHLVSRIPGHRADTWRDPREFDEDQLAPDPNRAHRNFRSRDRTTVEVRRLVCEVTWRWISEVMREQEGRERKGETGRGSWRMEEVLVDGVGGRCSSEVDLPRVARPRPVHRESNIKPPMEMGPINMARSRSSRMAIVYSVPQLISSAWLRNFTQRAVVNGLSWHGIWRYERLRDEQGGLASRCRTEMRGHSGRRGNLEFALLSEQEVGLDPDENFALWSRYRNIFVPLFVKGHHYLKLLRGFLDSPKRLNFGESRRLIRLKRIRVLLLVMTSKILEMMH